MQHDATTQHDHSAMQHGAPVAIPPGGLWGPVPHAHPTTPSAAPPLPLAPAPNTSAEMKRLDPAATLRPDSGDMPSMVSVMEAQKAAGGEPHEHGDSPPPDQHHDHEPSPDPGRKDGR